MDDHETAAATGVDSVMTASRLMDFMTAWNSHDVDEVMKYMAANCSYHASVGPELLGRSVVGRTAVREAFEAFLNHYPTGRFVDYEVFVAGKRGAAEWTLVPEEGATSNVRGCDIFEFEGDLISIKNSFRKVSDKT